MPRRRERTPFVGRRREQALLLQKIESGAPFLSLTGPSGLGKTRLAQQVSQLASRFFESEGGAWFCDLSQSQTLAHVEAAVARTLGVPQIYGEELIHALGKRGRLLLVLDNFDSVARQVGQLLEPWLDRCPNLQVIGTSIVPIGTTGEFHFALEPLEPEDAVELYMERAHRASVGRAIPEGEEALVEELVARLDRIPLAIELASARIRVFPPRALLARLDERLEILRGGEPGRHSSLEDALSLTWSLLSDQEQLMLRRASVITSGFGIDAAAALLDEPLTEFEIYELVDGLRAKALLQIEEGEHPRFSLYECVQAFARRTLTKQEEADAWRRHEDILLDQAEAWVAQIEGPNVLRALAWLAAERENLTAVLQRDAAATPAQAVRAGLALNVSFEREGFPRATVPVLEQTLEAARGAGNDRQIAQALLSLGRARWLHDQPASALEHFNEGLEHARAAGAESLVGKLLLEIATTDPGRPDASLDALIDEALQIGREHDLPSLESAALTLQGVRSARQGHTEVALHCYWRSLELLRGEDLRWHESRAWTCYGVALGALGRIGEARVAFHEALERARALESRLQEAHVLTNLGGLELVAGALDEAERWALEALSVQRRVGSRRGEAFALANLGVIALSKGNAQLAVQKLRMCAQFFEEANDRAGIAGVALFLAAAEAKVGNLEQGRRLLREGRTFFEGTKGRWNVLAFEVVEGILEVIEARTRLHTAPKNAEELVQRARQRLAHVHAAEGSKENTREAIRILEQDLESWGESLPEGNPVPAAEPVLVGAGGEWFERPGKERVDLRRRIALRLLLAALVQKRLASPGEGMSAHELFDAGWPGVEIRPDAAIRRVYIAIWTLRDLGLTDLIINQTDGYLLDHHVPLLVQEATEN